MAPALDRRFTAHYRSGMIRARAIAMFCAAFAGPLPAQGVATVEQVGGPRSQSSLEVRAVDPARSSAATAAPLAAKVADPVPPEVQAACRRARAQDRPAPKGVDCTRALAASAAPAKTPTAEVSLLGLFGQQTGLDSSAAAGGGGASTADQVAQQLSSEGFQGTIASDAAASVARDRPPPATTPPPR